MKDWIGIALLSGLLVLVALSLLNGDPVPPPPPAPKIEVLVEARSPVTPRLYQVGAFQCFGAISFTCWLDPNPEDMN